MASSKQQEDLDKATDRLYGLPLDKITSERNALASRLRKEGNKEEADQVKSLKKPTVAAWAVNQLARQERMKMRALTEAADRVRKAQAKVLGGGSPQLLQEADARLSKVIPDLRDAAGALLAQAGHPPSEALFDRVGQTLRAAVLNDADLERLQRGRLVEDLNPAGFGGLVGVAKAPRRTRRPERPKREELEKRKRELAAARDRLAQQRETVREAKKRLREEEAKLERAQSELERLSR
jgi:hypothetical protein